MLLFSCARGTSGCAAGVQALDKTYTKEARLLRGVRPARDAAAAAGGGDAEGESDGEGEERAEGEGDGAGEVAARGASGIVAPAACSCRACGVRFEDDVAALRAHCRTAEHIAAMRARAGGGSAADAGGSAGGGGGGDSGGAVPYAGARPAVAPPVVGPAAARAGSEGRDIATALASASLEPEGGDPDEPPAAPMSKSQVSSCCDDTCAVVGRISARVVIDVSAVPA